ncbi:DsbA family oxidoreductase [Marinobacter caseinilyticus]|uniref:DsbA family oxidoreductase n=1 Tax=Marinobacter caseinilyticus TaxID=2692195 RepID=UPI00140966F5|nr:DsbA family oxidoreductase [Marinobacter caseinilyticus]
MKTLQIDIVSDVACPWCAIGYKRLEQAMAELDGELAFKIEWKAFRLNPDMPPEGEPILEHLCNKYGQSAADTRAAQTNLMTLAAGLGLNFNKAQERRAQDTFDAHRLLMWARDQGKQTELKLALFDSYFGHARNPADREVLRDAAESVGLSGEAAAEVLASGQFADEVVAEERLYKQAGVSGVPAFIVNGRYMIAGAQEPATLVEAFREIASEAAD